MFDSAARGLLSNHLKLHVRLIVATTDDSVDVTWKASGSRCFKNIVVNAWIRPVYISLHTWFPPSPKSPTGESIVYHRLRMDESPVAYAC